MLELVFIELYRPVATAPTPPFRPGYGTPPDVLAGRDDIRSRLRRQLSSGLAVHHALYGPRGVGKTVLLSEFGRWAAEELEWHVVRHRLAEGQEISAALVERLIDPTRAMTRRWDRLADAVRENLSVGWSAGLTVSKDLSPSAKLPAVPDTALERALVKLGLEAAASGTAVLLLLDEFHSPRPGPELVRLSQAMQAVAEDNIPVHILAAGLRPPLATHTRGATFLERLPSSRLGLLSDESTRLAFTEPLARRGIAVDAGALDALVHAARGYPYFIQLFGEHTWIFWTERGAAGPITAADTNEGLALASAQVDSLYRGRYEKLSAEGRRFVHAMAEIGRDQPVGIAAIAERLGRPVTSLSTVRQTLLERHQIVEPQERGRLQFTLPWYGSWLTRSAHDPSRLILPGLEDPIVPARRTPGKLDPPSRRPHDPGFRHQPGDRHERRPGST